MKENPIFHYRYLTHRGKISRTSYGTTEIRVEWKGKAQTELVGASSIVTCWQVNKGKNPRETIRSAHECIHGGRAPGAPIAF